MARPKADALGRLLERMVGERKASSAREKKLVRALNGLLAKMGYQVVELGGRAPGRKVARRRRRRAGGGRGRPRGGRAVAKRGRKPGRPAKARARSQGRRTKGGQGT